MNRKLFLLFLMYSCVYVHARVAPFSLDNKILQFNKTDSVYMCSINDTIFGTNYDALLSIDSVELDSVWSVDVLLHADSALFPMIEGNRCYSFFLRSRRGDTTTVHISFTSMPIVALEGEFGYDYTQGLVSVSMPNDSDNLPMLARIKWRGGITNTTTKHKRNYKIKFIDTAGVKKEYSFFGYRKDSEWILNAGQVDLARCRNQIAHNLWFDISHKPYYADEEPKALSCVRGDFVEVLLNGEYRGIYSLSEVMDRKQMRLKKYTEEDSTMHGQLWKTTSWNGTTMYDVQPYDNTKEIWRGFETKYPELEDVSPTDYSTLYNAIAFVVNSSDEDFETQIEEYFDIPVVLDYYIFISVLVARDNNGKNMYWGCYDRAVDKKLTLAVWDLDCTIGQNYTDTDPHPESFSPYVEMNLNLMNLLHRLLSIPKYQYAVQYRYHELYPQYLNADSLKSRYVNVIRHFQRSGAAERESSRWSGDTDICGLTLDFEEELAFIVDWIDKRINFLNEGEFRPTTPSATRSIDMQDTKSETLFTIMGQPIDAPTHPGVYIYKGKKYLVK